MAEKPVRVNKKMMIMTNRSGVFFGWKSPKPTDDSVVNAKYVILRQFMP